MMKIKIILIVILSALCGWGVFFTTDPAYNWLKIVLMVVLMGSLVYIAFGDTGLEEAKVISPEDVISPELLAFLRKKRLFDTFWGNYLEGEEFRKAFGVNGVIDSIRDAFKFENTLEGIDFWYLYDRRYEELKRRRKV